MMICKKNRVVFLFNPKTGTNSIHYIFKTKNPSLDFGKIPERYKTYEVMRNGHLHLPLSKIVEIHPDIGEEIREYKIASFYRDPIDRFLSGMDWHTRKYPEIVTPEMTVKEYIEYPMAFVHQYPFLTDRSTPYQERHFDGIDLDWTLLNYHDFENEVLRLADMFKISLNKSEIVRKNEGTTRKYIDDLTQEEISMIKEIYVRDYEYLESQGIMVPSR